METETIVNLLNSSENASSKFQQKNFMLLTVKRINIQKKSNKVFN